MKKLLKHLSPLAPDDSGACSVLYELEGVVVICDAGGCAGNVCGFDEPRWATKRSALFSAGLRDMDAILGRDDRLVKKLSLCCEQLDSPAFTAIVGTPVPAVIATDYKALERMSERRTGLPCIALPTDGTGLYDKGEEMAYYRVFDMFAREKRAIKKGRLGVIGATPLNTGETEHSRIFAALQAQGWEEVVCFGLGSGLEDIANASDCEELLVIAPSGLRAARLLRERFGTPYKAGWPLLPELDISGKRVLAVHQQMCANAVREKLEAQGCEVTVASWFSIDKEFAREGDTHITGEDDFSELISRGFDVIIADSFFRRAARGFKGEWIDLPHFGASGRCPDGTKNK